jgi:pilus assembly protein Flp/PilA
MHSFQLTPWLSLARPLVRWLFASLAWLAASLSPRRAAGQGLVEYALVLVLIAIVVIGAVSSVGRKTSAVFGQVECTLRGGLTHQDNGNGNSNRCQ